MEAAFKLSEITALLRYMQMSPKHSKLNDCMQYRIYAHYLRYHKYTHRYNALVVDGIKSFRSVHNKRTEVSARAQPVQPNNNDPWFYSGFKAIIVWYIFIWRDTVWTQSIKIIRWVYVVIYFVISITVHCVNYIRLQFIW